MDLNKIGEEHVLRLSSTVFVLRLLCHRPKSRNRKRVHICACEFMCMCYSYVTILLIYLSNFPFSLSFFCCTPAKIILLSKLVFLLSLSCSIPVNN